MSPTEFWACDTWTVADALEGYSMSRGAKPNGGTVKAKLSKEAVRELQQMMKREEAKEAGRQ